MGAGERAAEQRHEAGQAGPTGDLGGDTLGRCGREKQQENVQSLKGKEVEHHCAQLGEGAHDHHLAG